MTNDHIVRLENAIAELADRVYRLENRRPVEDEEDEEDWDDRNVNCFVYEGHVYKRKGITNA